MMNNGYWVEARMKKWFKGKSHEDDAVDFQTKTTLYEVKSCRLYNSCSNANHKRNYKTKPHKKVHSQQHGRFFIKVRHHETLRVLAEKEGKLAKYIFCLVIGGQIIWRVLPWESVKFKVKGRLAPIQLKKIFGGE